MIAWSQSLLLSLDSDSIYIQIACWVQRLLGALSGSSYHLEAVLSWFAWTRQNSTQLLIVAEDYYTLVYSEANTNAGIR